MTITDVTESLLDAIAALEEQCFSLPWTKEQLRSQLSPRHIFLAAMDGEELLGYIGLMYVLDEGYISNVAVSPLHRRRGVARALIAQLETRCRALDLRFMTLEVRAGNLPAIALYENCGFQQVGLRKNYYQSPREDAILMTLEF